MDATDDAMPTPPPPPPPTPAAFGPNAASILATEHWSLLGTRSMLWNEAVSRTTVFLTVLSAAMVALALLADATDFGPESTTLALAVLPVVLFLGIATHARLVQVNSDEKQTVLAMNRIRHGYLQIAPELAPYFTAGHHDDERGFLTTYQLAGPGVLRPRAAFVVATPTVIAVVDGVVAAAIGVLIAQAGDAPTGVVVVAGVVAFAIAAGALLGLQRRNVDPLRDTTPRFPTPPEG